MTLSLELARAAHPHPNPRVGAAIVDRAGTLVGTGSHQGPGSLHAEVLAIREAGEATHGSTMYVTLEPCAHHGRTPPCTDAIVAAGITRVVVAAEDPDERVSGLGLTLLREAGIEVTFGVSEREAHDLDPAYFHHRRTGLPYLTLKVAATLDGQTAAADGTSQWITSQTARMDGHLLRAESDAVMVGAGTIRVDDPLLDVRIEEYEGPQPVPVIVRGRQPLPEGARVLGRDPLVLEPAHGEASVDLRAALKTVADSGLLDVLVEGGPTLSASLLSGGFVNRFVFYLAPSIAGGAGRGMFNAPFRTLTDRHQVRIRDVREVGGALKIDAEEI